MERLTFGGNFCDIAMCDEVRGGSFCEDDDCFQRKIWEQLKAIEDILGDDYDLDRLREIVEADQEGRCVVFQPGYAVVSIYNPADEDGLYTMSATGVITKEEYEAALRREQDG